MPRSVLFLVMGVSAVLASVAVACAGGGSDGSADPTVTSIAPTEPPAVDEVDVRLFEWTIDPSVDSVPAGSVTFRAENVGLTVHDLIIIRTDIAPEALPTLEDGSVDLKGEGIEVAGVFQPIADGRSDVGTFDLAAGSYVLLCNVVLQTDAGLDVHYQQGMVTPFHVAD